MALATTSPIAQVQSSYASSCLGEFRNSIGQSLDFAPEAFVRQSVLLDFADKIGIPNGCRVFSDDMHGVTLKPDDCQAGYYDLSKTSLVTRSAPMTPYYLAEVFSECKLSCQGLGTRTIMLQTLAKYFLKLRTAAISTMDQVLLKALSDSVLIDNCGTDRIVTAADDGVVTVNATGTGGLTDTVVGQVLVALSENNALSGNAEDVLLILPARAIEQWRASLPAGSIDFINYRNSSLVNQVRGMYTYTPLNQREVFVKNSGTPAGVVAYAIVRNALRLGYKVYDSMFDDPTANITTIDVPYGRAEVGPNVFQSKRGIHVAYNLQIGALRQSPWGIVRIILPTNIFG